MSEENAEGADAGGKTPVSTLAGAGVGYTIQFTVGGRFLWQDQPVTIQSIVGRQGVVRLDRTGSIREIVLSTLTVPKTYLEEPPLPDQMPDNPEDRAQAEKVREVVVAIIGQRITSREDLARFGAIVGLGWRRIQHYVSEYAKNGTLKSCSRKKRGRKLGSSVLPTKKKANRRPSVN